MNAKMNNLQKHIEQMELEKLEAQCIVEARQLDIDEAFAELETLLLEENEKRSV